MSSNEDSVELESLSPSNAKGYLLEKDFSREQLRMLFRMAPIALGGAAVCALVFLYIAADVLPGYFIYAWSSTIIVITLARYAHVRLFEKRYQLLTEAQWRWTFTLGAIVSGLVWGLGGMAIINKIPHIYEIFYIFIIGGLVAGSVATHISSASAAPGFSLAAIIPVASAAFSSDQNIHQFIGLIVLLYVSLILLAFNRIHLLTVRNIRSNVENQNLARYLERINESAARINTDLQNEIIHRARIEQALRESETRYRTLSNSTIEGVLVHENGVILDTNNVITDMLGYSRDEIIGKHALEFLAPESHEAVIAKLKAPDEQPLVVVAVRKNGTTFIAELRGRDIPYDGKTVRVVNIRDITEQVSAENELSKEKEKAQITLASIGDGVISVNANGEIDYMNPLAENMTGWTQEDACGKSIYEVFYAVHEESGMPCDNPLGELLQGSNDRIVSDYMLLASRNGHHYSVVYNASTMRDSNGNIIGAVLVFRDVTEKRNLENKLSYQAEHDVLTGLYNRTIFEARLKNALASVHESERNHSLLYIDLDQFKVVNDTCGHVAGDEMLKQVAAELSATVRDTDTLARLGGDEFGLLLERCPVEKAVQIADKILNVVRDFRFSWENKSFEVGVSIGVVEITRDSGNMAQVMSAADSSCYVAKDLGRNRIHIYTPDDLELSKRFGEMQWVHRITEALDENRFILYAQKISYIGSASDKHEHYEILVRMADEDGSVIPPMAFIPSAERYNLMRLIDRWVIDRTLLNMADSIARGNKPVTCSINLSGQSLCDDECLSFVLQKIDEYDVATSNICFEITETAAVANLTRATQFIDELRNRGCSFSLDDFGSGLSSFGYLKNLKVDYLKIDGSFVRDIGSDPIDLAMVNSINQIGHVMGIETIAEFVEDQTILERLQEIGVDYAQGYGIARPAPLDEVL